MAGSDGTFMYKEKHFTFTDNCYVTKMTEEKINRAKTRSQGLQLLLAILLTVSQ